MRVRPAVDNGVPLRVSLIWLGSKLAALTGSEKATFRVEVECEIVGGTGSRVSRLATWGLMVKCQTGPEVKSVSSVACTCQVWTPAAKVVGTVYWGVLTTALGIPSIVTLYPCVPTEPVQDKMVGEVVTLLLSAGVGLEGAA